MAASSAVALVWRKITALQHSADPLIVAIDGPAGIGKSTFSKRLTELAWEQSRITVSLLELDGYLMPRIERMRLGFDGYDYRAMDFHQLRSDLDQLFSTKSEILVPIYNHADGSVNRQKGRLSYNGVIIIDGIHSLSEQVVSIAQIGLGVFIAASDKVMRVLRAAVDVQERGYTARHFSATWESYLTNYQRFVLPERERADVVFRSDTLRRYRLLRDFIPTVGYGTPPPRTEFGLATRRSGR
jgi:uridine kinase